MIAKTLDKVVVIGEGLEKKSVETTNDFHRI